MSFLLLLDVDEVNDDDRMNIQGIPGPAGLEHHRRIDNIQGALYICCTNWLIIGQVVPNFTYT